MEITIMKKTRKIFIALALVLAAFVTTGCDLYNRAKEYYEDTYDTWYKYKKEVSIPVAGDENDGRTDGKLNNAWVYAKYNN